MYEVELCVVRREADRLLGLKMTGPRGRKMSGRLLDRAKKQNICGGGRVTGQVVASRTASEACKP